MNVTSRLLESAKAERASVVLTADLLAALHRTDRAGLDGEAKQLPVRGRIDTLDVVVLRD